MIIIITTTIILNNKFYKEHTISHIMNLELVNMNEHTTTSTKGVEKERTHREDNMKKEG